LLIKHGRNYHPKHVELIEIVNKAWAKLSPETC